MRLKRNLARSAAIALCSTLLLSGIDGQVLANTKKQISIGDFKKIESFQYHDSKIKTYSDGGSSLPHKVDLRDRGVVTPVKLQNPFGTCWAFGAIAASETSILTAMDKTYQETGLDLSEKHLSWFTYNALKDPYSSQNGEGVQYHFPTSTGQTYNYGGMRFYGSTAFSQGIGPTLESDYPYQGKNKTIYRKMKKDGSLLNYCYSASDDWSLDESNRFDKAFTLRDSIIIYSYAKFPDDDQEEEDVTYDEDTLEAIKKQIYLGKGVSVGYCADVSLPNEEGSQEYINKENWCQYTDEPGSANHEVCIVGYDDDYPINNYNEAHQPPKPGAFLVKNSWGSGENEFPNNGGGDWGIEKNGVHTGYFWLSYYDQTIEDFEIFDFDINNKNQKTEIIDQYDFAANNGANTYEAKKSSYMANVFTAQYNQQLREVSCITASSNVTVQYKVYLIDDGIEEVASRIPSATATQTYEYPGYHRQKLDHNINLKKGQKYVVLVTETNEDDVDEIILPYQYSHEDNAIDNSNNMYTKTIVNPGESYLNYDGEWYDWSEIRETFNIGYDFGMDPDNFSIKAYSVLMDDTDISNRKVTLSATSYEYDGTAKEPEVTIDGLTLGKDYTVHYASNLNVGTATVTITGNGKFTGIIIQHFSIVNKQDPSQTTTEQKATTAPAVSKITKIIKGKKVINLKWQKVTDANGYQIQYSLNKAFNKAKLLNINSNSVTKKKLTKLASKKKYYVRIRTYKIVDGKKYYSNWSKVKITKTK